MDVEREIPGDVQDLLRKDETVGGHAEYVGSKIRQDLHVFIALEIFRLEDGKRELEGQFLYGRRPQLVTAPGRTVRLRVNADDFTSIPLGNGLENHGGEIGRAHENDAELGHGIIPGLRS